MSSPAVQPSRWLRHLRALTTRRATVRSSSAVIRPAGHGAEHLGGLGVEVGEDAAEELAEDQRVHDGGAVLGLDRGDGGCGTAVEAVGAVREIGLIGPRAVVIGAPGADGQAEGHGVQAARVVAGELQPLDVRGQAGCLAADPLGGPPAAQGQQLAECAPPVQERGDGLDDERLRRRTRGPGPISRGGRRSGPARCTP